VILLRALGPVALETAAGRLSSRRKELALLTYLARRSPRPVSRAELAALLWEGTGEARARQSLRQALLELKRVVGDGLATEGEQVRLEPGAIRLDAAELETAIREGRPAEAVEWWRGDFLAGLDDVGGEAFRTWLEVERESLRQAMARALGRLAADASERGDWDGAAAWADRWTGILPLDERGHRHLVEALRLAGRAAEARARYAAAVTRLHSELDVEPGPELRRAGAEAERAVAGTESRYRPGSAALFTPDLIGRGPALAELEAAWNSSRSGTLTVVVIEGETGIGKSRLVEEFLRSVAAGGTGVIAVTVPAGGRDTPGGVTRAVLEGLAGAPGLGAAAPDALATVVALAPGIGRRFPALTASQDRLPTEDAVAAALTAVAEDRPVLLFVDNLELADDAGVSLLTTVSRKAQGRILIIAALGTDQHPAAVTLPSLTGASRVRRLKLPPLSPGEVEALTASMLVLSQADRHVLADRLHAEGGGNPLYTIELAAALVDEGALAVGSQGSWRLLHPEGRSAPLPTGLRGIIASRLARLSENARIVAGAMARLEPDAPESAARAAADLPAERFDLGRDELIARRLIRLGPRHAGTFQFSHEVVRRAVVEGGVGVSRGPSPSQSPAATTPGRARRRTLAATAVVIGVAVFGIATIRYLAARSSGPEPERRDVVVAGPELAPRASPAESAAALALRLAIDRAVPYRQLPAPVLRSTLALMRRQDTTGPPDEAVAREVALRTGTALVLVPSVARISERLTVSYRLADAESGSTLRLRQAEDQLVREPRRIVGRLVGPLGRDVSEALRRVPRREPLPQVTTASLEALRTYHAASQLISKGEPGWAPLMQRAIELDSAFAAPYGHLAYEYWFTYDQLQAAAYADAAERLARRLSTRERLQVMLDVTNAREDWPAAIAAARELVQRDRASGSRWLTLAQLYYFDRQYSRAVEAYDSAVTRYAPRRPATLLMNRATVLARVGREREAAALYEEGFAAESSLVRHPFVSHEYGVTLVRLGRSDDARQAYRRRLDDIPSGRAGGLRSLALLEVHLGHFALAVDLLTEADVASSASDDTLGLAIAHLLRAEIQLARGRRGAALADLAVVERTAAQRLLPYEVLTRSVKLLARLGATTRAESLLRRVETQTTAVSRAARARQQLARGELLLAAGRPVDGRRSVEQALALEPTDDALESAGFAAEATGAFEAAAERYDSLAAQHALDWDGHAVLELGRYLASRAWEAAGQPARAAAGYDAFLAAWPDPDPDLPAVADARRRRLALRDPGTSGLAMP
jgi:DNA-binding SARP family transcriptional activator/Tfp pilus assembly protein PilF